MRIAVKDIPSRTLEAKGTLNQNDFNVNESEIRCSSPVEIFVQLTRATNFVEVKARAKTKFAFVCFRCLESFEKEFEKHFILDYVIEPGMTHLEIGEDVRQEIIMSFPMKILCCQDCKGLCLRCGLNLNIGTCRCTEVEN